MSANAWGVCPKCSADRYDTIEALDRQLEESYGKVPKEEYERLQATEIPSLERTLREDWELRTDEDGKFSVYYSCSCRKCSFNFSFEHTEMAYKGT